MEGTLHELRATASAKSQMEVRRERLLAARDARAALIGSLVRRCRATDALAAMFVSVNIPGPDKNPPGLEEIFESSLEALTGAVTGPVLAGRAIDALGPWAALLASLNATDLKRAAIVLEHALPAGRLLDIDVYGPAGKSVDRSHVGEGPRSCLVCAEPAVECIRLGRHAPGILSAAVARIIGRAATPAEPILHPGALATALVAGAMSELRLTPKPGLVDLRDSGSHPDLSFDLMARSASLLPAYFEELIATRLDGRGLDACVEAGRSAERRMLAAIGTNAHRGFIFLGGLVMLAACDVSEAATGLDNDTGGFPVGASSPRDRIATLPNSHSSPRDRIATLAGGTLIPRDSVSRPGDRSTIRREWLDALRHDIARLATESFAERRASAPGTGDSSVPDLALRLMARGVEKEAMAGLPSVFDVGLPLFAAHAESGGSATLAAHLLMARLMQRTDDTTALRRCGPAGLVRLHHDGAELQRTIESGDDYLPLLERWNEEYRAIGLTMGGVADLMAVTLGIFFALHPHHPATRALA